MNTSSHLAMGTDVIDESNERFSNNTCKLYSSGIAGHLLKV